MVQRNRLLAKVRFRKEWLNSYPPVTFHKG
jgi:hypothetical protein